MEGRVFQEYDGVFETDYVIVSLLFMVSTVIFAGVSLVFEVINARMVPIKTINGRPGLFIWNGFGLLSGLISTSIFAFLYASELKYECLSKADREDRFSTHRVILGYSFWFLVVCDVLFLVNLLLVYITQLIDEPPKFIKRRRTADITLEPQNMEFKEMIVVVS
ncbi:clarin-2-like [Lytechinus pictus]|uniref:clarin-2-like n=1 Tax=Lytechinus pictus TaxID=7653 RepID=UPI0030BA1BBF